MSSETPSFGRAIDLAQRVAVDELRLLQLETREQMERWLRRTLWVAAGVLSLALAWLALVAAAVVALEGRMPLEVRLGLVAGCQAVLGAALVGLGVRGSPR
jgi:hypothetical protein